MCAGTVLRCQVLAAEVSIDRRISGEARTPPMTDPDPNNAGPSGLPRQRIRAVPRDEAKVRFLELFFDLVFVLAFTQCTALIVEHLTWVGIVQGLFVLAMLWWAWGGFAWLTSVVDPEEGPVRFVMFGTMAALLVVALTVPEAFGERGLAFASAYGVVRAAHIALFAIASRDNPGLRHSVATLAASTAIAIGLLVGASYFDGGAQLAVWGLAILIDFGGPAIFGVDGWRLVPAHFAERHGLIIILALGESIVALGVGAETDFSGPVILAGIFGVGVAAALWWIYFDVVALVTERRLTDAPEGRVRNAMARDSYSYLHYPMVAGIILVAVGMENTLAHVDEPLSAEAAFAMLGGVALYLLAHVALRLRNAHTVNSQRLGLALVLLVLVPVIGDLVSQAALVGILVLLWVMIGFETWRYGERRMQLRNEHLHPGS